MSADAIPETVTVVYYALLRDRAGRDRESRSVTAGATVRTLYQALTAR